MAQHPKYKIIGDHAYDLADGSLHEPETEVQISKKEIEHPHNQMLLAEGVLLPLGPAGEEAQEQAAASATAAERGKEG
jgi:hypothetical protein